MTRAYVLSLRQLTAYSFATAIARLHSMHTNYVALLNWFIVCRDNSGWRTSKVDDEPANTGPSNWEKEFEVLKATTGGGGASSKKSASGGGGTEWNNNFNDDYKSRSSARRPDSLAASSATPNTSGADAQQKFGGAKAISSDMYFDRAGPDVSIVSTNIQRSSRLHNLFTFQSGPDANLSRFQGSSSISSADYFGRTEVTPARGLQTPDMDDVKESVKQGVSKVAGRLSNVASGVMTQLQVRLSTDCMPAL